MHLREKKRKSWLGNVFKSRIFEFDNYIVLKMDNNFENIEILDLKQL